MGCGRCVRAGWDLWLAPMTRPRDGEDQVLPDLCGGRRSESLVPLSLHWIKVVLMLH